MDYGSGESVFRKKPAQEEEHKDIIRKDDEAVLSLNEFWAIMRESLRNPKSEKAADRFDARVTAMLLNTDERKPFEMLEREMRELRNGGGQRLGLDIRRDETDAFFSYTGAGKPEERIAGLAAMQKDVQKSWDAIAKLDAQAERIGEQGMAKLIALSGKKDAKKEEIEAALGSSASPALADAMYALLAKEEASSVAVRNALGFERDEFERVFGIKERNEMVAVLRLYKKVLGDARFSRAREKLAQGNTAGLYAEIRKMGIAAQYVFLSLLAPELVRGGMWNDAVLGMLAKVLSSIREAAVRANMSGDQAQLEYMHRAKKFLARFADYRGLNLAMFSAAFLSSLRK